MKPTIVLVGRPNVGKSTLFNRLTRSRDALVADVPGLTRDRHYGDGRVGGRPYFVVDTGGLEPVAKEGILHEMAKQTDAAIAEADAIIFLVDGRDGLTPQDRRIADALRRVSQRVWLVVNKTEGMDAGVVTAEFHELGIGEPYPLSAAHGEGVRGLMDDVLAALPMEEEEPVAERDVPHIAVLGRPNVGKSTLINSLLGEARLIAFDQPGTTRDSIHVPFERGGKEYVLIDTAGVRRRGKVFEAVEKFSVVKTLQAVDEANVVVLVLDARQEISDQDAHLAGYIVEQGRALVIAVNKWDSLDEYQRELIKRQLARKLNFLSFARTHFISALGGTGLGAVLASVEEAYKAAMAKLPTPKLTRVLVEAVAKQVPPRTGYSRPKLRYAHQGGSNPPIIVIHGTQLNHVPDSYRRYLEATFSQHFGLKGTPLRVEFRTAKNPYVDNRGKRK